MNNKLFSILLSTIFFLTFSCNDIDQTEERDTFTDPRDGHVYKTVQIGAQVWMAENLDYRTIDSSWYYNNDSATYHIYGRLYTWNRAMSAAPPGWHLPSEAEWQTLIDSVGVRAGGKLKEADTLHWSSPNTGATNESGFTALPGGYRGGTGEFNLLGEIGYWWSTTLSNEPIAVSFVLVYNDSYNYFAYGYNETDGLSIRCIKD